MYTRSFFRLFMPLALFGLLPSPLLADDSGAPLTEPSIVYKVQGTDERLEMIIHSTRILTTEQKIAQTAVENPDILETTLLSPTQVHISAKTTGVTKVNLWDENKKLYTIRVLVVGDARELALILRTAFPSDALKVTPVATSVMISGFVDKAEHIDRIVQIAEQYYPKVINNMTVGGCQQVSLHVKIMEVSRTKLRRLGFDWAKITGSNTVMSAASGLLSPPSSPTLVSGVGSIPLAPATTAGNPLTGTFAFNIANGSSAVLWRVERDGRGRFGEDIGRTDANDDQWPSRLLPSGRIVLHRPERTEWRSAPDCQLRNSDQLRADRVGQRANPPGSPLHHQ